MTWFPFKRSGKYHATKELLSDIQSTATGLVDHSERELQTETERLRERIFAGTSVEEESILVPGFALMNEAIRRTLGFHYYPVQLVAGLALARGAIAEMQTGEGKTLVAALPAFVHGLTGQGVHVITANSYLAERDCAQLTPAFACLGLSAKLLPERARLNQKQPAYQADITYGTGYEFGFDYLKDQVQLRQQAEAPLGQSVLDRLAGRDREAGFLQRKLSFAVIDEIDSVLIDDANSPLVLSEQSAKHAEDAQVHLLARDFLNQLERDRDFHLDPATGSLDLSESALQQIHAQLDRVPLKLLKRPWAEYVRQALRAKFFYHRNVQYLVNQDKVQLVDESTGRIFEDRHWREGLHQAVEAKEGVPITAEKLPLAQVSRQRFFRLYKKLCGMTGTATGSEPEFAAFYNLSVVPIPLRKPSKRAILPPRYFVDASNKWEAIIQVVRQRQQRGQPVLVGTRTISESEALSQCFRQAGVEHQLLNGYQDEEEAAIIARAGNVGSVTIATNMAGRGTDIKPPPEAIALGGLHVIGTQRHDSSRVDRQLIGRSARQGEPGSAQFLLCAEDALIVRHQPRLAKMMVRSANANGEVTLPITKLLDRMQSRTEREHYRGRQELFQYDQYREGVLNRLHGNAS